MTLSLIKIHVELLVKKMEQSSFLERERTTYTKLICQILNLRMLNAFCLLAMRNGVIGGNRTDCFLMLVRVCVCFRKMSR